MSGATEETLALLRRISVATEKLVHLLESRPSREQSQASSGGECAPDSDLDGQYGDPEIRKDPPRWKGVQIAPCRMSEGSALWLDELASFLDWQAGKDDETGKTTSAGKPTSGYKRQDAARARGWAKRIRAGWKPAKREQQPADDSNANEGW